MQMLRSCLYLIVQRFLHHEEGQDLVEYALVVALIAFGAIAGMQFLSGAILDAFVKIGIVLTSNIT